MTIFLTRSEVEELTYRECQQHMALLTTRYNLEQPLTECWTDVWPVLDQICDTLLYLEDRITRFEDPRIGSMDMTA
jgi:hypothetical protein